MLLARHLLAGVAVAVVSASTVLPAAAATAAAHLPAPDTLTHDAPVCLDATKSRTNGTKVQLWQCVGNANQRFVIDNGLIKVEDTAGTATPMCLDATKSRTNGAQV
ncbi:ricin-type beta-trefoil lectin domain protein, partial [Nonomuraea dietziae]